MKTASSSNAGGAEKINPLETENRPHADFEHCVVDGDDPNQLEALHAGLRTEFDPQSAEQSQLVIRLVHQLLRLRRASTFESAMIEYYRAEHAQTDPRYKERFDAAFNQANNEVSRPLFEQAFKRIGMLETTPEELNEIDGRPTAEDCADIPRASAPPCKPDLSFVAHPSFLEALCCLARYESQLTQGLDRTLKRLAPRGRAVKVRGSECDPGKICVDYEDASQFAQLRSALHEELAPRRLTEFHLVERIACLTWRLHRIPIFEAALLTAARSSFRPVKKLEPDWIPEHLARELMSRYRDPKRDAAEIERDWNEELARRRQVEKRMHELLGEDALPDLKSEFWFISQRDIQGKLSRLARLERLLERQLAAARELLHLLQNCRLPPHKASRSRRRPRRNLAPRETSAPLSDDSACIV